jgi:hypothetical protein
MPTEVLQNYKNCRKKQLEFFSPEIFLLGNCGLPEMVPYRPEMAAGLPEMAD